MVSRFPINILLLFLDFFKMFTIFLNVYLFLID